MAKDTASAAKSRLAAGREKLIEQNLLASDKAMAGARFEREHSLLIDTFLRERLEEVAAMLNTPVESVEKRGKSSPPEYALIAVGGYGREELCLHSDIDILIVSEKEIPAQALDLAQPLFLPLWDMGFDLGHGFRNIRDCVELSLKDFQVMASFFDLRLVAGSQKVYDALLARLQARVFKKKEKKFLNWLREQHALRLERYGDACMLLEPHLKEGIGGLRDYHRLLWLGSMITHAPSCNPVITLLASKLLRKAEYRMLMEGVAFLFRVRSQLHHLSGRRNEVLYLDLQPEIARRLGFEDTASASGVETFLARLHRAMTDIKTLSEAFWEEHYGTQAHEELVPCADAPGIERKGDELYFQGNDVAKAMAEHGPLVLIRIFEQCAVLPARLSWDAALMVRRSLDVVAKELAQSKKAFVLFRRILVSGRAFTVLESMLEASFLSKFLPEFGRVRDQVQFDAYHTYPVGQHSLVTVRYLEELAAIKPKKEKDHRLRHFAQLWKDSTHKERVLMGAFFHDIGKGNSDHAVRGSYIAKNVLRRFGVEKHVLEDVVFLVKNHLLLPETATRRDISDESVILDCAEKMGNASRLDMLYLLTYADSRATGQKAWNDWTSRLFAELYFKAKNMQQSDMLLVPHGASTIMKTRDEVRALAKKEYAAGLLKLDAQTVEDFLERMPPRYALRLPPEKIVGHIKLILELEKALDEATRRLSRERAAKGVVVLSAEPAPESGIWSVSLAGINQPGLFSTFAGIISLHDLNIFGADAFIWNDGVVVAVFQVSEPLDVIYAQEFWGRVKSALKFALTGKLSLDYRLAKKRESLLAPHSGTIAPKPEDAESVIVEIDNSLTDFYTVIKVRAWDRAALLYEIAHCLHGLQIEVHMAKVATHADHVVDYFYVRDAFAQKIEDKAQVHEVRQALLHQLSK